ncbi:MAG: ABC transporter permease [Bacteroidota bacterium]
MIHYFLKIVFRQFRLNPLFLFINVFGLTVAFAAFVLINDYVAFEKSYDRHLKDAERIVRVARKFGGDTPRGFANCMAALGPHAAEKLPQVEQFGRVILSDKVTGQIALSYFEGDKVITYTHSTSFFADQGIADMFISEWIEGTPATVLSQPNSIVLSESVAERYFGGRPASGKTLELNGDQKYNVTGVFKDSGPNTHLQLPVLMSINSLPQQWNLDNEWGWGNFHTYLRVTDTDSLAMQLKDIASEHLLENEGLPEAFVVQPVVDIHLHSDLNHEVEANGNYKTVRFLEILAWIILSIGLINFVNLFTAKAMERVRTVVLKKILGSHPGAIVGQLFAEILTMGLLAAGLSFTIVQVAGLSLSAALGFQLLQEPLVQLRYLIIFLLGLFLATAYPVVALSKIGSDRLFSQLGILKGLSLRKVLVFFQFAMTSFLVICTIVIADQKDFMMGHATGFDKDQVVAVKVPRTITKNRTMQLARYTNELSSEAEILHVGMTAHLPGYEVTRMRYMESRGLTPEASAYPKAIAANEGYFKALGFDLVAGRFFSEELAEDSSLVINEFAVHELGFSDPEEAVGKKFVYEGRLCTIVGVIKNYHQRSLKTSYQPLVFDNNARLYQYFAVRIGGGAIHEVLPLVEKHFRELYPNDHFDALFLDQYFDQQYNRDVILGQIVSAFSGLAIVISLLGLVGLSVFSMNQRVKEIGVRKVLGAGVQELIWLFNSSFAKLILASSGFSIPLAYLLMERWLEEYAYRIELQAYHFGLPLGLILGIALVTVGTIVMSFSRINPSEVLRNE